MTISWRMRRGSGSRALSSICAKGAAGCPPARQRRRDAWRQARLADANQSPTAASAGGDGDDVDEQAAGSCAAAAAGPGAGSSRRPTTPPQPHRALCGCSAPPMCRIRTASTTNRPHRARRRTGPRHSPRVFLAGLELGEPYGRRRDGLPPLEIPWRLAATTQPLAAGEPAETAISLFFFEPADEDAARASLPDESLVFLKFTASISPAAFPPGTPPVRRRARSAKAFRASICCSI